MQKLIGRNMFEQSLFAQCECGKEIIEFGEDEGEYFICYHSWYDRKLDRYSDFTFADKGALAELVRGGGRLSARLSERCCKQHPIYIDR